MLMPMLVEAPLVLRTFARYDKAELIRSAAHHLEAVSALEAHDADWAEAIHPQPHSGSTAPHLRKTADVRLRGPARRSALLLPETGRC
jgi:hypothetical protein